MVDTKTVNADNIMKPLTFKQYLINESLTPSPIDYGIDLHDKEWLNEEFISKKLFKNDVVEFYRSTFFQLGSRYYQVVFTKQGNDVQLAFDSSDVFDVELFQSSDKEAQLEFMEKYFSFNLTNVKTPMTVLNKVFYVALEGCEKFNIRGFSFKAAQNHPLGKLEDIYDAMFGKQGTLKNLEKFGIMYQGKENKAYLFKIKK